MRYCLTLSVSALGFIQQSFGAPTLTTRNSSPKYATIPFTRHKSQFVSASDKTFSDVPLGTASIAYFADIIVGTPPVTYVTLLDTGSSDLVLETAVQNDSCVQCVTDGPLYSISGSSTANSTGVTVNLAYGIGTDSGVVVQDVVNFGGFTQKQTLAACDQNAEFGAVSSVTALLGLALAPIAGTHSVPFVQELYETGQLDSPLFALAMAAGESNTVGTGLVSGGFLTIGHLNSSFYSGDVNFIALSDNGTAGFWQIAIDDVQLNGVSLNSSTTVAVVDSGTNSIQLPSTLAASIYGSLTGSSSSGNGQFNYPCKLTPNLTFVINGTNYPVPASSFNQAASGKTCVGAVTDGGNAEGPDAQWILGSSFMEAYYTAFRFSPPAVGLATLVDTNKELQDSPIPTLSGVTVAEPSSTGSNGTGSASVLKSMGMGALWFVAVLVGAQDIQVIGFWAYKIDPKLRTCRSISNGDSLDIFLFKCFHFAIHTQTICRSYPLRSTVPPRSPPITMNSNASYKPLGLPARDYTQGGPQRDRDMELGNLGVDGFFDEVASIREAIRGFEASIQTLSTKHVYSMSQPSDELSAQIDSLTYSIKNDSSAVTSRIAALGSIVGKDEAKRGHFDNLKTAMQRNVQSFQRVETAQRSRIRERITRQYKIIKPDANADEVREAVESNRGDLFAQAVAGSRLAGAQEALSEAQSRRAEVQKIEQTLTELAQLFQQVAELVAVQDSQIISIEDTTIGVEKTMEEGLQQISIAKVSAAAARHKRKLCAVFAGVIIFIIIIVVVVELKGSGGGGTPSSTSSVATHDTQTKSTTTTVATSATTTTSLAASATSAPVRWG